MATHIQIGDISPRIQYAADGVQTAFTYPFPIFTDVDIEVYEDSTLKTLTTDYAVTGAGNSAGGTVTFTAPPAAGRVVTLKRALAIRRTTDFQESGEFRAKVINDELDYQTAVLQQLNDDLGRSFRLADTDTALGDMTMPVKAVRASMYLGFDANGDPIATNAAGPMGPVGPAGNMDGSNNLSELTVPATARLNLGLVIGTDVLAPNGDGSGLTGIKTGATAAEKTNIMLNSFRIAVNGGLSAQNMVDGISDEFTDQTGVDLVASLNETYDAAAKLYGPSVTYGADQIPAMTSDTAPSGVASADSENAGYEAYRAMDNTLLTRWNGSAVNTGWLKYDFGSGVAKKAARYTIRARQSTGVQAPKTFTFEGSNDNAAWTVLDTQTGLAWAADEKKTFDITNGTGYRYYRVNITAVVTALEVPQIQEFEIIESTASNMTLQSVAITALAQPDNVFVVIRQEDVDAVAPNTDLTVEISRDGGITWTAVTLAEVATLTPDRILTAVADISAQPVGTAMKWRVKTLNNKTQKIHAVGLEWS